MKPLSFERWSTPALAATCVLIYVAYAGSFGLWDPWETHYGEVARQMAQRGDVISLHYPCSPLEGASFWSKPVLTFWLMAPCLRLFGLHGAEPGELVFGSRAEWALRTPSIVLALIGIAAIFFLVRRLIDRRAALWSAFVLATCPSWLLLGRQAMTDMPFVVPMTLALAFAARAILIDEDRAPRGGDLVGLHATIAVAALLPLALISFQLHHLSLVPYWIALGAVAWSCSRSCCRKRSVRSIFLFQAWIWCGVATLAKGPAGLALPALTIALYLIVSGRAGAIITLELPHGLVLFAVVAFPWYHAMHVRHGMPFWRELIGDNYVHRALGRHGDRGTFEYYLEWLGYGTFPWCGIAAATLLRAFRSLQGDETRARLLRFALVWLLVDYFVLTLVTTKFHHYLLPMIPALAIVVGLGIDRMGRWRMGRWLIVALPITVGCGLDLLALPQRITWLFDYDYVNAPGIGRAWPAGFDYRLPMAVLLALATLATIVRTRAVLVAAALAWSIFIADRLMIDLSPHWSQKAVIAAYYAKRRPDEPLLVWTLFWHGENFYTQNEIYRSADEAARTVFLGDRANEKLRDYIRAHPQQRVFFLVERIKIEALKTVLPSLRFQLEDDSNNKLVLLSALTPSSL
jgi:4-amino-4-deoxy-L-arabinose transferase-like glycosyltransferase